MSSPFSVSSFVDAFMRCSTVAAMRSALGLGSAATLTAGTAASNVVQLDGTAKLPAVDGSQLTNLPAGGSTLTRAMGTVQGDTVADAPATAPSYSSGTLTSVLNVGSAFRITQTGGTAFDQTFEGVINGSPPSVGNIPIETNGNDLATILGLVAAAILANGFNGSVSNDSSSLTMTSNDFGASVSIAVSGAGFLPTGTESGTNDVPAHGAVIDVELVAAAAGKKIRTVQALCSSDFSLGCAAALVLRHGGTDTTIATTSGPNFYPSPGAENYFLNGKDAGESLRLQCAGMPNFNGTAKTSVIVEQS